MGYGRYTIGGKERGYMVPDVCNHPGCEEKIDRGLDYLCYRCEGYFCDAHLTVAFCEHDEPVEFDCFAGKNSQCCLKCTEPDDQGWDCNCPAAAELEGA